MKDKNPSQLEAAMSATLNRRQKNSTLRALTTNDPSSIDFSSNDFLSLRTSPILRTTFLNELHAHPDFTLGSGGSRLLDGNSSYAERLETDIATFHRAPAALLCNSGYDANVGIFASLPQPGDVVVYDEYIHASVHDGMRASRAGVTLPFAHNSVASFTAVLKRIVASDSLVRDGERTVFIALEAVYSMDGDICPLAAIVNTTHTLLPHHNIAIIVDEAHATGVLGPRGAGLVCALRLEHAVAIRLHTFGKALSATGAAVLCSPLTKRYLLNYARPLIYTTFMSFPALAAVRAAYELLDTGHARDLARKLEANMSLLYKLLLELQAALPAEAREARLLVIPDTASPTASPGPQAQSQSQQPSLSPIFSVLTSEPRALAAWCQRGGFMVRPIVPPTVPAGSERVRVCLHAGNSEEEIRALVGRMREWCERQTEGLAKGAMVAKL